MFKANQPIAFTSIVIVIAIRTCFSAFAAPETYQHDHINAYPVASAAASGTHLTLDGDLRDWAPRTFIDMVADPDLKEFFSCKTAVAYDSSSIWIACRVVDSTPLVNHADPALDPTAGVNGDAVQLRLVADPSTAPLSDATLEGARTVQCTAWFYTDKKQPVLTLRHGMDSESGTTLTGDSSGFAYKVIPGGYQIEARILWSTLHVDPPTSGQSWRFSIQPTWGGPSGSVLHSFADVVADNGNHYLEPNGWGQIHFVSKTQVAVTLTAQAAEEHRLFGVTTVAEEAANIEVHYVNPADGYVSMAICKPDGQIVRTLLAKAKRTNGAQAESWDGLDDFGKAVPAGHYIVKALSHPGLTAKYVCSVMNSGNPGWGNSGGHYGWGADEGLPIGAASDPQGNTYLMWTMNEGGNFLIRVDPTGQKMWGSNISWGDFDGGATAIVYDNGLLYVAKDGIGTASLNHGGLFVFDAATGARKDTLGGKIPVADWSSKLRPATSADTPSVRMHGGMYGLNDTNADLVGLAASPTRIFVSLYVDNKIVALDKQTYKVDETYAVDRPGGIAYDTSRQILYAVSDDGIESIDFGHGGKLAPFVTNGLSYPYGLALDSSGNLYVSVRGKQMQVLVYDSAGHPVRTIGVAGGRPWIGKFNPNGMLLPSGMSVDTSNHLWVSEYDVTPKRISLWDCATGKLIKDFYGSAMYAVMMAPDPDKPEHVYLHNCRFVVDYDKGTWRPDATVFRANYDGNTIPGSEAGAEWGYGFMGGTFEERTIDGKKFALNGYGGVFSTDSDRFRPLYYLGGHVPGLPQLDQAKNEQPWNTEYRWIDSNHDGCIQDSEVVKIKSPYLFNNIDELGGAFYPGGAFIKGRKLFRPNGLSADGIPMYPDPADALPLEPTTGAMAPYNNWLDVWPVFDTNYKQYYAVASLGASNGGYNGGGGDCIVKFTPQGKIFWRYNRVSVYLGATAPLADPGDLFSAWRIAGEFTLPEQNGGGIVGIGCYRGYFGYLNEDGLFIDQTGVDNGHGPARAFDTFFIENFSGYLFKHPRTGKVYLFCGDVDGRILEIQGWDKIRRFNPPSIDVTTANYTTALALMPTASSGSGIAKPLRITAVTPKLDGTMNGWSDSQFAPIKLDKTRHARVGMSHDATNLYVRFDVQDSSPWKNSATDWRFLFKGGDAVDVQLGSIQPQVPGAKRASTIGDVRVMIGPSAQGGIQAVGMWPLTPSGMPKNPMTYKSPVDQISFERVDLLASVTGKVFVRTYGFTLVAAIPWASLGMPAPTHGTLLSGDAGILQSDASGVRTLLRRYLFNQDTGVVNDIPSEASVVSANWGILACD